MHIETREEKGTLFLEINGSHYTLPLQDIPQKSELDSWVSEPDGYTLTIGTFHIVKIPGRWYARAIQSAGCGDTITSNMDRPTLLALIDTIGFHYDDSWDSD